MRVQFPTEEELRDRIERHLEARRSAPKVVMAWSGYLAALTEWGLIDQPISDRLAALLPKNIGVEEICEIMLGPDYRDVQQQLSEEAERGGSV